MKVLELHINIPENLYLYLLSPRKLAVRPTVCRRIGLYIIAFLAWLAVYKLLQGARGSLLLMKYLLVVGVVVGRRHYVDVEYECCHSSWKDIAIQTNGMLNIPHILRRVEGESHRKRVVRRYNVGCKLANDAPAGRLYVVQQQGRIAYIAQNKREVELLASHNGIVVAHRVGNAQGCGKYAPLTTRRQRC